MVLSFRKSYYDILFYASIKIGLLLINSDHDSHWILYKCDIVLGATILVIA